MTKQTHQQCQGNGLDGFYHALRRPGIRRSGDERWFAGVSGGLARWLGVDPLVVRAAFILLSVFFGVGVTLYLVLWLLLPHEDGNLRIEQALRRGDGGSIFLLVITVMSVFDGGPWFGGNGGGFRVAGFVAVVVGGWLFLTRTGTGRELWASVTERPGPDAAGPDAASPDDTAAGHRGGPVPVANVASTGNAAANAGASLGAPLTPSGTTGTGTPTSAASPRTSLHHTIALSWSVRLLVLGLAIVTGVTLGQVAAGIPWPGNPVAVGIASGLGVLGLGILVAGLAGRRPAGLDTVAAFAIIAAVLTTIAPNGLTKPWQAGDRTYAVTSLAGAQDYQLGAGNLSLDLSRADYRATPGGDTVKVTLGMGQLDLVVPAGAKVTVHASGRAGDFVATGVNEIGVDGKKGERRADGVGWSETVTYGPTSTASAVTEPDIVVEAAVGLGEINVSARSAS